MRVRHRLILSLTTLVGCTAVLGAAALAGLLSLSQSYERAEEQYGELRAFYEVGSHAAAVRLLLDSPGSDPEAIEHRLFEASRAADAVATGGAANEFARVRASIKSRLADVSGSVGGRIDPGSLRAEVNGWLARVSDLAASVQAEIVENRRKATARFTTVIDAMGVAFGATILMALAVGISQYRAVMVPLRELDRAVGEVEGNRFEHRVRERGDREFRRVTRHFNRMSSAVGAMHASMRQQVEAKTRQLLRSEQLAGVGSLAAGLAHEINNPLGIIAGYAQSALRRLDSAGTPEERERSAERARRALRIISEETFRCRDIAAGLLSMAQPPDASPRRVEVVLLVRRAVDLVRRLPAARGRTIGLSIAEPEAASMGQPSQVLQVLMNLLTNALEACPEESGAVEAAVTCVPGWVTISIADNGCGMETRTLEHAFEPFFTDKPRRGLSGCGLGLSVSHAIVERHGGRMYAHSDGPGLGSIFTVELPAAPAASRRAATPGEGKDARGA